MRDFRDRALDRYPDYPPGFRPCDLEPRFDVREVPVVEHCRLGRRSSNHEPVTAANVERSANRAIDFDF
jgi:hypothetical protein